MTSAYQVQDAEVALCINKRFPMPRQRQPVKVACRICHDRRVKCDRKDGVSCSNCRNAQLVCEPIASRRGRYEIDNIAW